MQQNRAVWSWERQNNSMLLSERQLGLQLMINLLSINMFLFFLQLIVIIYLAYEMIENSKKYHYNFPNSKS